ncbi:MAG: translation elongation factor Ts [candidate division Zixibacteria bacterium]|nr:translation elongation factor Ts [candidate division Zixibacteria bacterium]
MAVSAQDVMALRERTGAGMMECKKALTETGGDPERAISYLREKGLAKAAGKAGRAAKEGLIYTYIHPGDKLGVMVEINCETDFVARTDEFRQLAKDVAMQVAASNPTAVRREELDPALIESERQIYRTQVINEGKPEKIIDKIVDGKLEKFFAEACLMEQAFVKQPESTVGGIVQQMISRLGENIIVKRFVRFRLGES